MKQKKALLFMLAVSLGLSLAACGNNTKGQSEIEQGEKNMEQQDKKVDTNGKYLKISPEEAKAMLDENMDTTILLDVRREDEYAEKHIPGALLIPNEDIIETPPKDLPLDATILIYCRSGNRSAQAAKKLIDMGYTKVYDFGGIKDWSYETVLGSEAGQPVK